MTAVTAPTALRHIHVGRHLFLACAFFILASTFCIGFTVVAYDAGNTDLLDPDLWNAHQYVLVALAATALWELVGALALAAFVSRRAKRKMVRHVAEILENMAPPENIHIPLARPPAFDPNFEALPKQFPARPAEAEKKTALPILLAADDSDYASEVENEGDNPPAVFLQALQTTRKQWRRSVLQIDVLQRDLSRSAQRVSELLRKPQAINEALKGLFGHPQFAHGGQAALEAFTEMATATLGLSRVTVWRADPEMSRMECLDQYDTFTKAHLAGLVLMRDAQPAFFALLAQETLVSLSPDNAQQTIRDYAHAYREGALMVTPIRRGDTIAGALFFEHSGSPRAWMPDEENLFITLAHVAANLLLYDTPALESRTHQLLAGGRQGANPLERSEELPLYRWLVESSGGLVFSLDRAGSITYLNPAAEHAYKREARNMLGHELTEFAREEVRERDADALKQITEGEPHCVYTTKHLRGDGGVLPLRIHLTALQDEFGEPLGIMASAVEIKEQA